MTTISLKAGSTLVSAKVADSIKYAHGPSGFEGEFPLAEMTEDGWAMILGKLKRFFTDGIQGDWSIVEIEAYCDRKGDVLRGLAEPKQRSGDPVAAELKAIIVKHLTRHCGYKTKEVPKLGTSLDEVWDSAIGCGLTEEQVAKGVERAKANVARANEAL